MDVFSSVSFVWKLVSTIPFPFPTISSCFHLFQLFPTFLTSLEGHNTPSKAGIHVMGNGPDSLGVCGTTAVWQGITLNVI